MDATAGLAMADAAMAGANLAESYSLDTAIFPGRPIDTEFIKLWPDGKLLIRQGYAWNGADGVIDMKSIMRASAVHGALYQLIQQGHLSPSYREIADRELRRICVEDEMPEEIACAVYDVVRVLGGYAADPEHDRPVRQALEKGLKARICAQSKAV
jgi:hypothetical protein